MNFNIFKKHKKTIARRAYAGAKIDRLTNSWTTSAQSINNDLRVGGKVLRARARDLSINNDYVRKYLSLVTANVVGSKGITLQSKSRTAKGKLDDKANRIIEQNFKKWQKPINCASDGRMSFLEMQRLFIETSARDGECLIRFIRDGSKYGLKLQFLDTNRLDETYNLKLKNGNVINMGIEINEIGAPVAYHLLTNSTTAYAQGGRSFERVPAEDMIHAYKAERPEQIRGATWMASAMSRLNMLGAYEEAELVAARVGASKMGFYTSEAGDSFIGNEDAAGNLVSEAEPGTFEQLPAGTSFTTFDPTHPTSAFKDFNKCILRGISGGLGVSYNSLSSDLESVSFSSIRSGTLEERDQWRVNQQWMIDHFLSRVYNEWLGMVLLNGSVGFSFADHEKLSEINWQPRGWAWVDPLKDIKANTEAVMAGIKTASEVVAEQGSDIEDVYQQLQYEQELAKKYGLNLSVTETAEVANEQTNQNG